MRKESNYIPLDKPIAVTEQVWPNDTIPVVSVFNWVYNHKDFIRESIESILMQKTTFPVEIIIHDDASNDGTKEIILEYKEKHPLLFRNILHDENQWSQGKSVMTPLFEKPRGKYIALTHGDDYWTDPHKLQKQVDLLEVNENISICVHQTEIRKEDEFLGYVVPQKFKQGYFGIEDLLNNNRGLEFQTSSFVYKRSIYDESIFISGLGIGGDFMLLACLLKEGKIYFLNQNMSVYRKHEGGVTSVPSNVSVEFNYYYKLRNFVLSLKEYYNSTTHSTVIHDFIKGLDFYLAELSFHLKKHDQAKAYLNNSIFRLKTFRERKFRTIVVLFVYCYFPKLYSFLKSK